MAMIVIAHNPALVGVKGLDIQGYFYGFHVANFFLLSFALNNKSFSWDVIKKQVDRLIKPMIVFLLISAILYNLYMDVSYDFMSVIKMFSFHAAEIKHGFGFKAFWFPVAFLSFYILCVIFNSDNNWLKFLVLILGLFVHVFYYSIVENKILLPGAMLIALYLLPVVVVSKRYILSAMSSEFKKSNVIPAILFLIVLFIYKDYKINIGSFRFYSPLSNVDGYIVSLVFMQLGFAFTWCLSIILKNNVFLSVLGKYSYQVYFIHLFFNFALVTLIGYVDATWSVRLLLSLIATVITLYISTAISQKIMNNKLMSKIF